MTTQPEYKTLPGGSIDYAHYTAKGRTERSLALHATLRAIAAMFRKILCRPVRPALPRSSGGVRLHPAE